MSRSEVRPREMRLGREQIEQRSDPETFLGRMPEQALPVDLVQVPAAGAGPGDITGGFQVSNDGLDSALRKPHDLGDVAHPGLWTPGDLNQDVPVPGEQSPGPASVIRNAHT